MGYQLQSADTSYEAEQVQIDILRKRGEAGRGELMRSLTRTTRAICWNSLRQRRADLSRLDCAVLFVSQVNYLEAISDELRNYLKRTAFPEDKLLTTEEMLAALTPVIEV